MCRAQRQESLPTSAFRGVGLDCFPPRREVASPGAAVPPTDSFARSTSCRLSTHDRLAPARPRGVFYTSWAVVVSSTARGARRRGLSTTPRTRSCHGAHRHRPPSGKKSSSVMRFRVFGSLASTQAPSWTFYPSRIVAIRKSCTEICNL